MTSARSALHLNPYDLHRHASGISPRSERVRRGIEVLVWRPAGSTSVAGLMQRAQPSLNGSLTSRSPGRSPLTDSRSSTMPDLPAFGPHVVSRDRAPRSGPTRRRDRQEAIPGHPVGPPECSFMAKTVGLVVAAVLLSACGRAGGDEALDVSPSCGPAPVTCQQLLEETFKQPPPGLPPASVGPLQLVSGEKSGKVFLWVYNGDFGADRRNVIAGVKERAAGGYEPPTDAAAFTPTPAGRSVVLRTLPDGTVSGLDFWTSSYHYTVSLQGAFQPADPVVGAAMALVDALPEPG